MSIGAIVGLIILENKLLRQKIATERAFQVAEGGLNSYRWRLSHDSDDLTGVTEQAFYDPEGGLMGYYTITAEGFSSETVIEGKVTICHKPGTTAERTGAIPEDALAGHLGHGDTLGECSTPGSSYIDTSVIVLTATGWTEDFPNNKRTIKARYGKPSLAKYAFVTDSNIWFGSSETITGTVHSNGGIRMDGTCDSLMTTIKEDYICGAEHGCADEEKPGIWGSGEKAELWDFPVTEDVDFDAISVNLDDIKTAADSTDGKYIEASGSYGYVITFINDGTFSVQKIKKMENAMWSYNGADWVNESLDYKTTDKADTYTIPTNGLIFIEDDVWVQGEIDGRVTLVAARLPDDTYEDANIYIPSNITYTSKDGLNALGLIAQNDILITYISADDLEIDAALLAQKGHVYRNYIDDEDYPDYAIRNSISIYGTIMSKGVWTFSWVETEDGPVISGYDNTTTAYDPYLFYSPPPSYPSEDEYEFISWEEVAPI
jgi:hypothetical protein